MGHCARTLVAPLRFIARHLAVFAVVAVVLGLCLGSMEQQSATGERNNATITAVASHHSPTSIHFDGVLTTLAAAIVGFAWALERASATRALVPVATTQIRRRGPPALAR